MDIHTLPVMFICLLPDKRVSQLMHAPASQSALTTSTVN